jgi:ribosome biogenesis protein Nip4
MIEQFISQFTEQKLLHVEKIGRQYYQMQPELKELMMQINSKIHRQPVSAGLFLGEDKGKEFKPSIALLDIIGHASNRWVMVDDKAEWLFLCGRDILGQSVLKANVTSGLTLVVNSKKEILGYGKITGNLQNTQKMFVKNILDCGDYLRREMGKK